MLCQDIGRDTLAAVEVHKFDLPGVEVNVKPRRHYIPSASAAHLIGYMGEINADELKRGAIRGAAAGILSANSVWKRLSRTLLTGQPRRAPGGGQRHAGRSFGC